MSSEFKLTKVDDYYDVTFTPQGDFTPEEGFDSSLIVSVLEERRANSSEISEPIARRGWWGNTVAQSGDPEVGSKNWLLSQARNTDDTANLSENYTRESLEWLEQDAHISSLTVEAIRTQYSIDRVINFVIDENETNTETFSLWENTGSN